MSNVLRIVVSGKPQTKKTGLTAGQPRRRVQRSKEQENWFLNVMSRRAEILAQAKHVTLPIYGRIHVRAHIYTDYRFADLAGYMQAVGHMLQGRKFTPGGRLVRDGLGILVNDRQIDSWDGTRVFIDRYHPRLEMEIIEL
jgi:hypothetical protein